MSTTLTPIDILLRICVITLASGVIGFEREHHNRPAGLRTHILVGLGAATVALIEAYNIHNATALGTSVSIGRMTAQVISGIGFLGAGTILVHKHSITGLTTAASLWNVGCLGVAAGYGYMSICLIGTGATLIVLTVIRRILPLREQRQVEIAYGNRAETIDYLNKYFSSHNIRVLNADLSISREEKQGTPACCVNRYALEFPAGYDVNVFLQNICENENILNVRMSDA